MGFIRENSRMVLIIVVLILLAIVIVFVSTNTSIFNEDKRLANEVNKVDKGEIKEVKYDIDLPDKLDEYAKSGESIDYDKLSDDEKKIADSWTELRFDEDDKGVIRDLKMETKSNIYKSIDKYIKNKDITIDKFLSDNSALYGDVGFGEYAIEDGIETGAYYSNDFKQLGDLRIEGVSFNSNFSGVILDIRNKSDELISRNTLKKDLNVSINGIKNSQQKNNYKSIKENGIKEIIGLDMYKSVIILLDKPLYDNVNNESGDSSLDGLPHDINVSISLGNDNVDYKLIKNKGGYVTEFNMSEEMRLRN